MVVTPDPILFEEGVVQRGDLTFWVFNEASPEVLEWLKNDCAWAYWIRPKVSVGRHPMGGIMGPKEWGKEVEFLDKGGALEFKLRWYKNAK